MGRKEKDIIWLGMKQIACGKQGYDFTYAQNARRKIIFQKWGKEPSINPSTWEHCFQLNLYKVPSLNIKEPQHHREYNQT